MTHQPGAFQAAPRRSGPAIGWANLTVQAAAHTWQTWQTFPVPQARDAVPLEIYHAQSPHQGYLSRPPAGIRRTPYFCQEPPSRSIGTGRSREPLASARACPSAPQEDGRAGDHRQIVRGALLIVRGDAPELLEAIDEPFDGLFTNDKFCLSRFGQLSLTWWRYPLRLRGGHSDAQTASPGEVAHQGGSDDTAMAHSPADVRPPRRAATLGPRVSGDPGMGGHW
jgi:hypothetical protein